MGAWNSSQNYSKGDLVTYNGKLYASIEDSNTNNPPTGTTLDNAYWMYVVTASIAAGVDTQVQFNDGGTFGGDAGFTYDKTTDALVVAGSVQSPAFQVGNPTDTTISRVSAGVIAVEGGTVPLENRANTFTANQIISVTDNTNAALRITQLGTGDALLIEDSANPDATPFVINDTGVLISGHTSPISTDGYTGIATSVRLQVHGVSSTASTIGNTLWNNSTVPVQMIMSKSRSGTIGSYSAVQSGDGIGGLVFAADDGSAFITSASIIGSVDGTPATNDMPGRLIFATTAAGNSAPTELMRIYSAGNVVIGTTAPDARLSVNGIASF